MSQMSHVKKVREIFESHKNPELESLDISQLRLRNSKDQPFHTFKRSQTLIDFRRLNIDDDEDGEKHLNGKQHEEKTAQNSVERKNDSQRRQFERQNSNNSDSSTYRSVRRSPAFRRAEDLKKPVTPPKVIKLTRQSPIAKPAVKKELFDELQYLASSETIKKALRSPLPAGPAPPKPPRTFVASPQITPTREINIAAEFEKREDLKEPQVQSPIAAIQLELEKKLQIKPKTLPKKKAEDQKKTLGNIFQCIIPTCSIDPIYKEQIKREQAFKRDDEKIYMEPFAHLDKEFNSNDNSFSSNLSSTPATNKSPAKTEELHYMCTNLNIFDQTNNSINNNQQYHSDSRRSSLDEENNYYSTNSSEVETNESYDKVENFDHSFFFVFFVWLTH